MLNTELSFLGPISYKAYTPGYPSHSVYINLMLLQTILKK